VDLCTSRLVFIHNFSLKQAFMSYRYFHIIFIIFGHFLCFSTLDRPCICGICIAYFYKNFVFLATTPPLYRQFIHHIFAHTLCYWPLGHPCTVCICITYFCLNFIVLGTLTPVCRQLRCPFFDFDFMFVATLMWTCGYVFIHHFSLEQAFMSYICVSDL